MFRLRPPAFPVSPQRGQVLEHRAMRCAAGLDEVTLDHAKGALNHEIDAHVTGYIDAREPL